MVKIGAPLLIMMLGSHLGGCIPLDDTPSFFEYGRCAAVSLMDNFQMDQYVGKWYSVRYVPSSYVSVTHCVEDDLSLSGEGLLVKTSGMTSEGAPGSTQASLTLVEAPRPYLQLRAPFVPPVPYHIVYTDYRSVSCVYSCLGLLGIKAELLWVLSRTVRLPHSHLQHCLNIFASQGLNTTKLLQVEQEDCGAVRDVDHVSGEAFPDEEGGVLEGVAPWPSRLFSEDDVMPQVPGIDGLDLRAFLSVPVDVLLPKDVPGGRAHVAGENAERQNESGPGYIPWARNVDVNKASQRGRETAPRAGVGQPAARGLQHPRLRQDKTRPEVLLVEGTWPPPDPHPQRHAYDEEQQGRHVDPGAMWEVVENDVFNSSTGRVLPTILLLLGPIWLATLA